MVLVAALMISIGLHWALLQSVAWVGMAVTYTVETGSVAEGLSETFDGDHPCPLCHIVDKGTQSESSTKDKIPAKDGKDLKFALALVTVPAFVFEAIPAANWIMKSEIAQVRREQPAAPPPRGLSVA